MALRIRYTLSMRGSSLGLFVLAALACNTMEADESSGKRASSKGQSASLSPDQLRFSAANMKLKVPAKGGSLICSPDTCPQGVVAYGPYTRRVLPGRNRAVFLITAVLEEAVDEAFAVDVYDANASMVLVNMRFGSANLPSNGKIPLEFVSNAEALLEFRVHYFGKGTLTFSGVEVQAATKSSR